MRRLVWTVNAVWLLAAGIAHGVRRPCGRWDAGWARMHDGYEVAFRVVGWRFKPDKSQRWGRHLPEQCRHEDAPRATFPGFAP